jgi:hypothetical protein
MSNVQAYLAELASKGRNGDTILAHINPQEAALLKALGGSGTRNPETGAREFFLDSLFDGIGDFFGGIGDLFGGGGGSAIDWGANNILDPAIGAATTGTGNSLDSISSIPWDQLGSGVNWENSLSNLPGTLGSSGVNTGSGATSWLNSLNGVGNWFERNMNWLLPVAGLGYMAMNSRGGQIPNQPQLMGNANYLTQAGKQLTKPLLDNAPLPSGAQSAIDLAKQANEAAVRSAFASMGLSGSTMEAQALQNVANTAAAEQFKNMLALATQGFNNIGAANSTYAALANAMLQQDQAFTNALGAFLGALGRNSGLNYVPAATGYR